jgi:predicted glycosyltransferase
MRLLFDIGHPAHVHLFRNLIKRVQQEGGEVLAATRDKDVTVNLCRAYKIPQIVLSQAYGGRLIAGGWELLSRTVKLFQIAIKFKPDALLGTSMSIGVVGRITGRPSFVFSEDNAAVVPLFSRIVYPTCKYVVTPECLKHENYGPKHLTYPGYHELAYLHPDHFTPDPEVPRSIGLEPTSPYFILRFVTLKAHHDFKARGLPLEVAKRLVDMLAKRGRLLISSEGELLPEFKKYQFPLHPDKLHDVLAFASMYIGDSQTVAIEAAMMGVPSLRCNTFARLITILNELENDYGLTKAFLPEESDKLLAVVQKWLNDLEDVKKTMKLRRRKMLENSVNLAEWQWQTLCDKL